ncbi:heavy metal-binding domain-containing protein [Maribacter sp. HTCC2170]|uniref:heavy metal-binding domain-containing protein n=1 Tax=Maribacter sp. (strain HTCC2170 / KCCM 42371) TaxID=313603 RepID=UPI00006AFD7F|nr:heavy metal-binding domain-containing protein [Maribacter sp. HTCC2170]EAR01376.1 hypothetical protein FB2170_11666 [Maribacter sp. HTCC2170]
MKTKTILFSTLALAFSFVLFISCKDQKANKEQESYTEMHASAEFQCPMDCEDGKTYKEAGSCPVCKMDLKAKGDSKAKKCAMHEGGDCSCEGDKCKCANCKEHAKKECKMHEGGDCSCEGDKCKCSNCKEHAKKECKMHEGGECSCEGDDCKCENCTKHS